MRTRMRISEMIVAGLAVVLLMAGFASGVFAKPAKPLPPATWSGGLTLGVEAGRS
jgi:hypothetical protein